MSSLPTIASPIKEQIFYVNPSVGDDTLGETLMKKDDKSSFMWPIYFAMRMMERDEKGYNVSEQVVFALIFAMTKFKSYFYYLRKFSF